MYPAFELSALPATAGPRRTLISLRDQRSGSRSHRAARHSMDRHAAHRLRARRLLRFRLIHREFIRRWRRNRQSWSHGRCGLLYGRFCSEFHGRSLILCRRDDLIILRLIVCGTAHRYEHNDSGDCRERRKRYLPSSIPRDLS
jgi:hypothetical protein